jgi:hypothetical protein
MNSKQKEKKELIIEKVEIHVMLNQENSDGVIYFNDVECAVIKDEELLKTIEVPKNISGTLTIKRDSEIICDNNNSEIKFDSYQFVTPCQK